MPTSVLHQLLSKYLGYLLCEVRFHVLVDIASLIIVSFHDTVAGLRKLELTQDNTTKMTCSSFYWTVIEVSSIFLDTLYTGL